MCIRDRPMTALAAEPPTDPPVAEAVTTTEPAPQAEPAEPEKVGEEQAARQDAAMAATGDYPAANMVSVDGGKDFKADRLYFRNGEDKCSANSTGYNAHYDPTTGTLTLNGYNGKAIELQGAAAGDLTIKLIGNNIISSTTSRHGVAGNSANGSITITADSGSGGKLTINATNSTQYVYGIDGYQCSVTITGSADVTISTEATNTGRYCFGINSNTTVSILENASVNITSKTPNNTSSNFCRGINGKKVAINTDGKVKIDVTEAGDAGADSYGVCTTSSTTLTKVGEMQVKWKKGNTIYVGGAISRGDSFDTTTHAVNVDETNCYASYRHGTPYTVTVVNGTLTGLGVPNATERGNFLQNDTVNIKPYEMKGKSGEEIPFKEWTADGVTLANPTTASNSFTVPAKNVTVTAKHNPFDGTPTFTPTSSTNTTGTLTFKTVVKPKDATEYFKLVKEGDEDDESKYIDLSPDNSPEAKPYEYRYNTDINHVEEGNYYVAEKLYGAYYLSEKFTVSYTAPTANISLDKTGTVDFGSMKVGYTTAPAAQTVTITNNGTAATGTLAITLDGSNAGSFTVSPNSITDIPAGGNATFTVRPKTGLTAGTYTATVKASGTGTGVTAQSFDVKFTVYDPGASAAVSGTIKSYGSASEAVTVTLTPASGTPLTTTVTGNNAAYSFPTVPAGEYTLKVEKTGHAPFSKVITVGSNHVTENVTIYLVGDVNGDGAITADDLTALARHVAKISVITDTAALARCDVTKDGSVTADDLTMLARYVAKIISSFD